MDITDDSMTCNFMSCGSHAVLRWSFHCGIQARTCSKLFSKGLSRSSHSGRPVDLEKLNLLVKPPPPPFTLIIAVYRQAFEPRSQESTDCPFKYSMT